MFDMCIIYVLFFDVINFIHQRLVRLTKSFQALSMVIYYNFSAEQGLGLLSYRIFAVFELSWFMLTMCSLPQNEAYY